MFDNHTDVVANGERAAHSRVRSPTLGTVDPMTTPTPPAEAILIEEARRAARPKLTVAKAAQLAEISEARWRQITRGVRNVPGDRVPTKASAEVLARMARAVGVDAEQLRQVGRPDGADWLDGMSRFSDRYEGVSDEELLSVLLDRARRRGHDATTTTNARDTGWLIPGAFDLKPDQAQDPPEAAAARKRKDDPPDE